MASSAAVAGFAAGVVLGRLARSACRLTVRSSQPDKVHLLDLSMDTLSFIVTMLPLGGRLAVGRTCTALAQACSQSWSPERNLPFSLQGLAPRELATRVRCLVLFADVRGPHGARDVHCKLKRGDPRLLVRVHDVGTKGVPSRETLEAFDSVFVYHNALRSWPGEALGDVLAEYVEQGGGAVIALFALVDNTAEFTSGWHYGIVDVGYDLSLGGRWRRGDFSPTLAGRQDERTCERTLTLGRVVAGGHPVMSGVSCLRGGRVSYFGTGAVAPNARVVATWRVPRNAVAGDVPHGPDDEIPLVVEVMAPPAQGRTRAQAASGRGIVLTLNLFPQSSDSGDATLWDATSDGDLLMANAVRYVCRRPALREAPSGIAKASGGPPPLRRRSPNLHHEPVCTM